jgi:hypothetical protein
MYLRYAHLLFTCRGLKTKHIVVGSVPRSYNKTKDNKLVVSSILLITSYHKNSTDLVAGGFVTEYYLQHWMLLTLSQEGAQANKQASSPEIATTAYVLFSIVLCCGLSSYFSNSPAAACTMCGCGEEREREILPIVITITSSQQSLTQFTQAANN